MDDARMYGKSFKKNLKKGNAFTCREVLATVHIGFDGSGVACQTEESSLKGTPHHKQYTCREVMATVIGFNYDVSSSGSGGSRGASQTQAQQPARLNLLPDLDSPPQTIAEQCLSMQFSPDQTKIMNLAADKDVVEVNQDCEEGLPEHTNLNQTPQMKLKRPKYIRKAATKGNSKSARKPATTRKYVRKNGVEKLRATPVVDEDEIELPQKRKRKNGNGKITFIEETHDQGLIHLSSPGKFRCNTIVCHKGGDAQGSLNETPCQNQKVGKHRPKVVTEGTNPKSARKPMTKLDGPSTRKRKYVRKKGVAKSVATSVVDENETTMIPNHQQTKKRCKRKIDFDESVKEAQVMVDRTCNMTGEEIRVYQIVHESEFPGPIIPRKTELPQWRPKRRCTKAKGKINFVEETLDKRQVQVWIPDESSYSASVHNKEDEAERSPESFVSKYTMESSAINKRKRKGLEMSKNRYMQTCVQNSKMKKIRVQVLDAFARKLDGRYQLQHAYMESYAAILQVTKKNTKEFAMVASLYYDRLGCNPKPRCEIIHDNDALIIQSEQLYFERDSVVPVDLEKNALVVYQQDKSLVPYQGLFDPMKKKRQRPKVDLDKETKRVWMLLSEDSSNSNGSDNDKEKWWEEERMVFCGRANSFIARMRLLQGDRQFCEWKGSVLNSVVGAILTQNVSDHISSSAFMHLGARFPLKLNTSRKPLCEEELLFSVKEQGQVDEDESGDRCTIPMMSQEADSYEEKEIVNNNESSKGCRKVKKVKTGKTHIKVDWNKLRSQAEVKQKRESLNTADSMDYEAIRTADVNDVAEAIINRGMHNKLARIIKDMLDRLVRDHQTTNLEWLRDVPPDKAKEYLLSFKGLGLKSVECIRLLTLHQCAFPVDTNVGRIAVRLGWVPLQPLPESVQFHLLELYPAPESIQKYLWPRLRKLDQRTLYELHYQMITFGKVFCTKTEPNCNACPLRGECRHFASASASAKLSLPAPEESISSSIVNRTGQNLIGMIEPGPIVEMPTSPEQEQTHHEALDIEDFSGDINLNFEEFTWNLQTNREKHMEFEEGDMSKALLELTSEAASIPTPKLKSVSRLRTEHQVYVLPDSHPLLEGMDTRETNDPSPYLLAIWSLGETADSIHPPQCCSQESGALCNQETCFFCNTTHEANSETVPGTLLIPCRTAMRGNFPLNGTYFQLNEVFADHKSSLNPIDVPRSWLWMLPKKTVYFGTSVPTIFKGMTREKVQDCFRSGFVCVRGFDHKERVPRPLVGRLHYPASRLNKLKPKTEKRS